MNVRVISMAHAARSFLEVVAKVQYQHKHFLVKKGTEIIANISPANPTNAISIDELMGFLKQLPILDNDEMKSFSNDVSNIRTTQVIRNPWE